jgi:hypothetical protein
MCKKLLYLVSFVLVLSMAGKAWPGVSKPNPADGALHEDTWINLSWQAGRDAASFDVYFDENIDNVNEGTPESSAFRGNQTGTFFIAGFPGYPYPEGLVPGTTYYWRIDEIQTDGTTIHRGSTWSFTIPSKTARNPDPPDGAEFIDPNTITLSWTVGFGAKLHTVYIGEDFDEVNNATGGSPQGATTYSPAPLELEKVYYWRVDEFDVSNTYKGDIWSFTTPGAVGNPQPSNGAVDVKQTQILTWTPATHAASHQVYLGTDQEAVKNATTASPEYKGSKAPGNETLDPGKLDWDSVYYWRVDAVYDTDPDNPVKGLVWSFKTANFLIVDDFEDYNAGENQIWYAWKDGLGYGTEGTEPYYPGNGSGSAVGDENTDSYTEETIVHGGAQSMPLAYDNNKQGFFNYSEVELTLTYPRDWTENDVNTLTLYFRGNSGNAAERMYVALNGSALVYHDDPGAAQIGTWTVWNIDLQDFANQGIDLANINTMAIGFGDKANPVAGGAGTMYFDDIRLATAAASVGKVLLLVEDFESVVLGTTVEESAGTEEVWTNVPPAGWTVDNSGVPGIGDPAVDGVTEWAGWAFVNRDWWFNVDPQGRDNFQLSQGTIAVADPDEWDDSAHPPDYNVAQDSYDTWLTTPAIDISGVEAGTLQLKFDSSWRPEFDSDYHQSAIVTASFDGEEEIELLLWLSDPSNPNYKPENLANENETVVINVDNPPWATSMVLTFGMFDAGNDWWWAIDNIEVSGFQK